MTRVRFLEKEGTLCGFSLSGHSSKSCDDELGKTVCAAVSSAAYMAANTVTEIIGDKADAKVGDAEMEFIVHSPSDKSAAVLEGFRLHIKELSEQYGNNVKIYSEV